MKGEQLVLSHHAVPALAAAAVHPAALVVAPVAVALGEGGVPHAPGAVWVGGVVVDLGVAVVYARLPRAVLPAP